MEIGIGEIFILICINRNKTEDFDNLNLFDASYEFPPRNSFLNQMILNKKTLIYSELLYKSKDFNDTNIKKFMDNHVSREIVNWLVINNEVLNQEKVIDVDKLFEETINKMNEINEVEKPKILSLK